MRKDDRNKFAMYRAVENHLVANTGSWQGIPAFGTAYTLFTNKLSQLETFIYNQGSAVLGASAQKLEKREEAAVLALEVAAALKAYAAVTNNPVLKEYVKISRWKIVRRTDLEALQALDQVIEKATEYLNQLDDFGVDQAKLGQLVQLRQELGDAIDLPRQAILSRKSITRNIRMLVKEIDGLLRNQIDQLAQSVQSVEPQFYLGYQDARVIIDYGTRHNHEESNGSTTQNRSYGGEE